MYIKEYIYIEWPHEADYFKPALLAVFTIICKFSCSVRIWFKVSESKFSIRSACTSASFLGRNDNTPFLMGILTLANLSGILGEK